MSFYGVLVPLLCIVCVGSALFEDQIGKFDWRRQYIGEISYALSEARASTDSPLFVSTEASVLAAINKATGELLWRQALEDVDGASQIVLTDKLLVSLSPCARLLRAWSKSDGQLRWESWLGDTPLQRSAPAALFSARHTVDGHGRILATSAHGVHMLRTDTGDLLATVHTESSAGDKWLAIGHKADTNTFHAAALTASGDIRVYALLVDGEQKTMVNQGVTVLKAPAGSALPLDTSACVFVQSTKLVCISKSEHDLLHCDVASASQGVVELQATRLHGGGGAGAKLLSSSTGRWLAVHHSATRKVALIAAEQMDTAVETIENVAAVSSCHNHVSVLTTHVLADASGSAAALHWYDVRAPQSPTKVAHGELAVFANHAPMVHKLFAIDAWDGAGSSLAILGDTSAALYSSGGERRWRRHEALSGALAVQMVDLPLSESQADIETEFEVHDSSIVAMLLRRLRSQATQARRVLITAGDSLLEAAGLLHKWGSVARLFDLRHDELGELSKRASSPSASSAFVRDYFNLHKVIVVATRAGALYGLDNRQGAVLWQVWLGEHVAPLLRRTAGASASASANGDDGSQVCPLYVLRTTAHHPLTALAAVVYKNTRSGTVVLHTFDPITGVLLQRRPIGHSVTHAALLPMIDDKSQANLLMLADPLANRVTLYPEVTLTNVHPPVFVMNAVEQPPLLVLAGYTLRASATGALSFDQVWKSELTLGTRQRLYNVLAKNPNQRVHSMGRVLGDRNVLYKYVNPNLVAVFTAVDSTQSAGQTVDDTADPVDVSTGSLSVYLIDAVTGQVLMQEKHSRSQPPIMAVHCENWLMYTYWNEKARRTELTVSELYEGVEQTDAAVSSSLAPTQRQPTVFTQSYIFPQGVSALGVTETERGLTHRMVLAAMPFGGLLEIPKQLLDPRRPLSPTQQDREEGLIPYMPEVPVGTQAVFNYNQSVARVRRIDSFASGLESTALVFATGLDMFYTRLTPSGTFDALKDDFDHWIISAALFGLLAASAISKRLARRRDLQQAWR